MHGFGYFSRIDELKDASKELVKADIISTEEEYTDEEQAELDNVIVVNIGDEDYKSVAPKLVSELGMVESLESHEEILEESNDLDVLKAVKIKVPGGKYGEGRYVWAIQNTKTKKFLAKHNNYTDFSRVDILTRLINRFGDAQADTKAQIERMKKMNLKLNDLTFLSESEEVLEVKKEIKTGKSVEIEYLKNPEKAPDMGSVFGQDVEAKGDYITNKTSDFVPEGFETGKVKLENPLVVDITNDTQISYKKDLSEKYGGLTGEKLSEKLRDEGYDSIVTKYDDGSTGEIILLNNQRTQPKSEEILEGLKQARKNVGAESCWSGYVAKGTKMKGGDEIKPQLDSMGLGTSCGIKKEMARTEAFQGSEVIDDESCNMAQEIADSNKIEKIRPTSKINDMFGEMFGKNFGDEKHIHDVSKPSTNVEIDVDGFKVKKGW